MGTPPIQMANLGMADSLILMVMALVVFGPRRLPQIGRQIGKLMYEFRKASNDFKFQMEEELRNAEEADRRKKEEERLKALALAAPKPAEPVPSDLATPAADTLLTPAIDPPAAVDDPYAQESLYPPVILPKSEETYPRILPPSIGEHVAAAPPNTAAVHSVSLGVETPSASEEAPAPSSETTAPETIEEQATHHA